MPKFRVRVSQITETVKVGYWYIETDNPETARRYAERLGMPTDAFVTAEAKASHCNFIVEEHTEETPDFIKVKEF